MAEVETLLVAAPARRLNVTDRLAKFARAMPDSIAVVCPHRRVSGLSKWQRGTSGALYDTITFAELEANVARISTGLAAWGVPKGTRLALLVKPGIEFVTLVFALLRAGMVIVLVDPGLGRRNLIRCISEAEPGGFVAIGSAQFVRVVLRGKFPRARWNVTVGHRWLWGGKTLDELRMAAGQQQSTSASPLSTLTRATSANDPAAIIFTSGSTGPPKGVLYTQQMFDTQVEEIQSTYGIEPGGIDLACFPLFALFNAAMGVATVLPEMDFSRPASADPEKLLAAAKDWRVSQAFGSPAVWRVVSDHCARTAERIESLRQVFSCGAPVPADVLSATLACVAPDARMHTPYGATECLPVSTIEAVEVLGDTAARTDQGAGVCVGRKFDSVDWLAIRITDHPIAKFGDAEELPAGEIGELIVRGPQVSPEYVTRIVANAQSKIADRDCFWHRTGDVGYLDEHGRFWYCGRKAQRVQTAAGPLYTECVEGAFNRHPDVEGAALVGVGRPSDQLPVIAIKLKPCVAAPPYSGREALTDFSKVAATVIPTTTICDCIVFDDLPVDIRHNSKIDRELVRKRVSFGIMADSKMFHPELVARARLTS
jgi:olefin beta-lactone synthetase